MNKLLNKFFAHKKPRRVYLDYAATTPVRPEVLAAMLPYFSEVYGNPSAVHGEGLEAKRVVEEARTSLARTLRVRASDVVFTSGGTESNNLAIYGTLRDLKQRGVAFSDMEIISTRIEHPSIAEVLKQVAEMGCRVKYVDVDSDGFVDRKHLAELLSAKTVLVSLAYVNSEIGVIQDVRHLSRVIKAFNKAQQTQIKFHLDACQAPLWLPIQLDALGVDLLSLDAGKCYGPKGVGVLAFTHRVALESVMLGGSQEKGLRAGTENVPLIVGCSKAIELAQAGYEERSAAIAALRDHFIAELTKNIPDCTLNGSVEARVANNINLSIKGIDTEFAVIHLDKHGIAASTKSACSGADGGGSSVVREISGDEERARSTIRFSLGESTKQADLDRTVNILKEHVEKMREFQKTLT